MNVETKLFIWWLLFGGAHVLGSASLNRAPLVRALGLKGFKGIYSLVALATFIPLVFTYWYNRHAGDILFATPIWTRHITETLMLFAFLFIGLAHTNKSPATTRAEMTGKFESSARGILRVTRHPQNAAFALFGLAHMASNTTNGDWIFWGGFVVFAVVSAIHQDRRLLATGPAEFRTFYAETSAIPFLAILQGRQRLALREINWGAAAGSVVLWIGLRLAHPYIIGGFAEKLATP